MTVTINAVPVALGTSSAPLIEGGASTTYSAEGGGVGFSNSSPFTGRRGCRVALAAVTDFTTHTHVGFGFYTTSYWLAPSLASVAAGGLRVVLVDASGNYAGFNVYGSGIPDFEDSNPGRIAGFMSSFANVSSWSDRPVSWQIDRLAQPAISAGVINWAQIVAVEVTVSVSSPVPVNLYIGELRKLSDIVATGAVTPESILGEVTSAGSTLGDMQHWVSSSFISQTAPVRIISAKMGWHVGDGTTPTHFTAVAVALGFFNTFDTSPTHRSVGPLLLLAGNKARQLLVNQSASDTLSMTDCSVSSAAWWQWELSGSGVATCMRVQFWRFNGFKAAHGHYVDCAWNDADSAVEVTAATVISGGLIRGAKATGLKVLGAAGVYSNLDLSIDSMVGTYDIELGAGGAGTYELPHITVPAGRTLRVRNNSASNAVVVKLPLGLAYSTSTAGGAITVTIPEVSVSIAAPALIAGSRVQLYSITDGAEMLNGVLGGAGLMYTALYTGNKIIRLRADHATKLPLETLGVLTASGLTFLDVQVEDDVYLGNGIDGGSVTEFAPDGAHIEVDINDPDGVTDIQRLYAWLQWYMTTEEGVRSAFFGAVSAIDSANYVIDQAKADIRLDNVAAFPVRVVGGYLSRRDGSTVIAPLSHSIQMDPGKAYAIETGVSGLTADESTKLNQISLLALETTAQSAATAAVAAAVQATEAADNTAALLASPAPTAAAVAAAVWGDAKAGTLALEATTQEALMAAELAASRGADLLASPAPTVEAITDGVWTAVDALALEATADAAMQAAELAASRTAELLTRPALTADAVAEGVWAATAAAHQAQGTMGQQLQGAALNAALAATLSA